MLTDRRRLEITLPSVLFGLATVGLRDGGEGALQTLCQRFAMAAHEALLDLSYQRAQKFLRRVERQAKDVIAQYHDRPTMLVLLALLYWLQDELDAGTLVLHDGTAGAQALDDLIDALSTEHGDLWDEMERSARKNARRIGDQLRAAGLYPRLHTPTPLQRGADACTPSPSQPGPP